MGNFAGMKHRKIEILAPASSLEGGRVALSAGADAVYIGAPKFGARSTAGVSLEDIATLTREAHAVGARVYVALNTILTDEQLPEAVELAHRLYEAGADALIVQDMGLVMADLPPIPLHASTQCHNSSRDKLRLLEELGVEQVVLPREVSTADLDRLLDGVGMRVEAFVHGALCVSYSGRCYISEACRGRSANRGACAQYCRMSYDLEDAEGSKLLEGRHLLSLRDLNRTEILEELLDLGVSSLKIEGRLKGIDYVRNVTAHYRRALDVILARRKEYTRASWGEEELAFDPQPERTFSRRFTTYNTPLHRPIPTDSITPFTNKSVGEEVGTLLESRGREVMLRLRGVDLELSNGDGLLFVSPDESETSGALVNQVTPRRDGAVRLKLSSPVEMAAGARVFRNLTHQLDQILRRPDASVRRVPIRLECRATEEGSTLRASIAEAPGIVAEVHREIPLEPAKRDNADRLKATLGKLGGTPYEAAEIHLETRGLYLPPSVLTEMRREVVEQLAAACHETATRERDERGRVLLERRQTFLRESQHDRRRYGLPEELDFTYNVANHEAEALYRHAGVMGRIAPAMEIRMPEGPVPVMYTRHCLLHQLGYCTREGKRPPFRLPLYLVRGRERFRVSTNCRECLMTLWKDE